MKKMLLAFILGAFALSNAIARPLPEIVTRDLMGLRAQGQATMRFLGFKVYDVYLWTAKEKHATTEPFALHLIYDMSLSGKDIAERSVGEMRKQGHKDEEKLKRWGAEMARIFPDIKKGDSLVGLSLPGKEVRFYSREKMIAAVADAEFANAFFDIWLSEKTSEPALREKLFSAAKDKAKATD